MNGLILVLSLFLSNAEAALNCHELQSGVEMQRFLFRDCMLKTIDKAGGDVRSLEKTARRCAGKVGILRKIRRQLHQCQFRCPEDSFAYDHWGRGVDVCEAVQRGSKIRKAALKKGIDVTTVSKFVRLGEKGIPLGDVGDDSLLVDIVAKAAAEFPPETDGLDSTAETGVMDKRYFDLSGEGGSPLSQGTTRPALEIKAGQILSGSLHREIVSETLIRSRPRVEYCFFREWKKNRELAGDIEAQFDILANGRVGGVSILSSTLQSERVEYCVKRLVSMMTFSRPSDGKPVIAKYTFVYNAPF